MSDKVRILREIIDFNKPYEELLLELRVIWWTEDPLIILTRDDIKSILMRFLKSELNAQDIEKWANLIEWRDDIDYVYNSNIVEIIFELANPEIMYFLTEKRAKELIKLIDEI